MANEFPDVVQRLLRLIERAREELGDTITESKGDGVRLPDMVDEPWVKQVEGGS